MKQLKKTFMKPLVAASLVAVATLSQPIANAAEKPVQKINVEGQTTHGHQEMAGRTRRSERLGI
jgi:hypothetical protein